MFEFEKLISFLGLCLFILICWLLSENKKAIAWHTVIMGIVFQLVFALFILKTSVGLAIFDGCKNFFEGILSYANEGGSFLFGNLTNVEKSGFIFAFLILPTVIFMGTLMSVLYHLRVMEFLVKGIAFLMVKVMKTSGSESLSAAANIFIGQTEAPLVIRPFLHTMTRSELMALMTGGMATVAGGVLAAYVGMGIDAGHLLAASVMSAPASLVCAKLLVPETQTSVTLGTVNIKLEKETSNIVDAATKGASDGLMLALNIGAMLIAFIALVALVNGGLTYITGDRVNLELIMSIIFRPVAYLMGVSWEESHFVAILLGKKLVFNEFVAYLDLQKLKDTLSPRAFTLSTYALCGFANFASVGIQIGGIGALAPSKRPELCSLGMKSLLAGTIACLMTACVAGLLV